jgi:hypothetical protein
MEIAMLEVVDSSLLGEVGGRACGAPCRTFLCQITTISKPCLGKENLLASSPWRSGNQGAQELHFGIRTDPFPVPFRRIPCSFPLKA